MKIIKLTAENVKRLKAIEIKPDGNLIVIGGMNGQGKTSTIDSIAMAFGGKKYIPPQPVRKGEKKAKIVCETEDLIVTRTMTPEGGGSLKVSTRDGKIYQSPQSILDAMTGQLTFDPLAFSRMDDKAQLNTLKGLVGLDFSELDQKRSILYEERTTINREGKRLVGALASMTDYPDAPDKEVLVSDLMEELDRRVEYNEAIDERGEILAEFKQDTAEQREQIGELISQIEKLEDQLKQMRLQKDELIETVKNRTRKGEKEEDAINSLTILNTQEIKDQISSAEETNRQVRANQEIIKFNTDIEGLRKQSQELNDKINQIDGQKAIQLSEAKFPIEGLSFNEDGVLFDDIPFSQLASSEQLRISTAMGFAMNPELKILLIRDGSLLDQENLKLMADMTEKEDAQIWIERVGEGQEVSVIIEDGNIKQ